MLASKKIIVLVIIFLFFNFFYIYSKFSKKITIANGINNVIEKINDTFLVRDFFYYNCKDERRIGGPKKLADPKARAEGAWFVCFDDSLAPEINNCNVLSFGINMDDSFDYEMNKNYKCNVYSFDPFDEGDRFKTIRESNKKYENSVLIPVNEKWKFYRIGIIGSKDKVKNRNKIGWIETLDNIIKHIKLEDKVIDIFKIDVDIFENNQVVGFDQDVLEHLDIDYACKYFKQFLIETHSSNLKSSLLFNLLKRLEKCFKLFRRDTRLIGPNLNGDPFRVAANSSFKIDLKDFETELNLINFLLSVGELFFINENFL